MSDQLPGEVWARLCAEWEADPEALRQRAPVMALALAALDAARLPERPDEGREAHEKFKERLAGAVERNREALDLLAANDGDYWTGRAAASIPGYATGGNPASGPTEVGSERRAPTDRPGELGITDAMVEAAAKAQAFCDDRMGYDHPDELWADGLYDSWADVHANESNTVPREQFLKDARIALVAALAACPVVPRENPPA